MCDEIVIELRPHSVHTRENSFVQARNPVIAGYAWPEERADVIVCTPRISATCPDRQADVRSAAHVVLASPS